MTVYGNPDPAPAWPRAILHLDMDAFYVNVHILDNPQDKGVPLVIGGPPQSRGVVASASYEARQLGIRSAMPTSTSDHEKPAGCTIVLPGAEAAFLAPLPVRVIWGIGPRAAERLAALGVTTCGQLAAAAMESLQGAFGRQAAALRERAGGLDERPVAAERADPKSVSQEWTFDRDVNDPAQLEARLRQQAESVAQMLQKQELVAHTIRVKFRWADFTTFTRQKSLTQPVDDPATIAQLGLAIWREHWPPGQRMRLIGLGTTGLTPAGEGQQLGRQLGLPFAPDETQ